LPKAHPLTEETQDASAIFKSSLLSSLSDAIMGMQRKVPQGKFDYTCLASGLKGEKDNLDLWFKKKKSMFQYITYEGIRVDMFGRPLLATAPAVTSQPATPPVPAAAPVVHNVTAQSGGPHASEQDKKDSDAIVVETYETLKKEVEQMQIGYTTSKLPPNFSISQTSGKPICFCADDSIKDLESFVSGAIDQKYDYKGYCCKPEKFPWEEIYTRYFQDPKNSKLFFDFDGTISKVDGQSTVFQDAYRDFFINGHEKIRDQSGKIVLDQYGVQVNLGYNRFILKGGTEDEIMDNFIENLKRPECALFRIDPKFIGTMCVCEKPPEKIHIVTRNGVEYVRRILMAEIELSLISSSIPPDVARNQARNFVDQHFDINSSKITKAENVKEILNRTAVPAPLAPAAVGPSSSVSTNVSTSATTATTATPAGVGSVALPSTEKPSLTPVRDPATDNRADHSTEPVANQATSLTQGGPESVNRGLNLVNSSNLDPTQPRSDAATVVPTFTALPGSHQASESALFDKIEDLIRKITDGIQDRWYFKTGAKEKTEAILKSFDDLKKAGFSFNDYTSLEDMQKDQGKYSKLIKNFIDALQMSRGFFETNKDDVNSFKKFKQEFNGIIDTTERQDLTLKVPEAKKSQL